MAQKKRVSQPLPTTVFFDRVPPARCYRGNARLRQGSNLDPCLHKVRGDLLLLLLLLLLQLTLLLGCRYSTERSFQLVIFH